MACQFWEWQEELEPQASSARRGGPPRKLTGIGVLDPPGPPKRPLGPLAALPSSFLVRLLAGVILAALAALVFFMVFLR